MFDARGDDARRVNGRRAWQTEKKGWREALRVARNRVMRKPRTSSARTDAKKALARQLRSRGFVMDAAPRLAMTARMMSRFPIRGKNALSYTAASGPRVRADLFGKGRRQAVNGPCTKAPSPYRDVAAARTAGCVASGRGAARFADDRRRAQARAGASGSGAVSRPKPATRPPGIGAAVVSPFGRRARTP